MAWYIEKEFILSLSLGHDFKQQFSTLKDGKRDRLQLYRDIFHIYIYMQMQIYSYICKYLLSIIYLICLSVYLSIDIPPYWSFLLKEYQNLQYSLVACIYNWQINPFSLKLSPTVSESVEKMLNPHFYLLASFWPLGLTLFLKYCSSRLNIQCLYLVASFLSLYL